MPDGSSSEAPVISPGPRPDRTRLTENAWLVEAFGVFSGRVGGVGSTVGIRRPYPEYVTGGTAAQCAAVPAQSGALEAVRATRSARASSSAVAPSGQGTPAW